MNLRTTILFLFLLFANGFAKAQTNPVLSMSELLALNARFKPYDESQIERLKTLDQNLLHKHLVTNEEKLAFWINIYNSFMLIYLRDTAYEGVYTNFYKTKNITIGGVAFSLFEIENEFIRIGKKSKALGFKKSKLKKGDIWIKLRPTQLDSRAIFLMYKGLYGYPPFQIIENVNIESAFKVAFEIYSAKNYDWLKKYAGDLPKEDKQNSQVIDKKSLIYSATPFAIQLVNFYPKYEGPKFIEEEPNPWVK